MSAPNFNRDQILQTWRIFRQPGEVLELRILNAGRYQTVSGYFNDPEMLANAAIAWADEKVAGIFFTVNPVNPDLLSRATNHYEKNAKNTTADANIIALRWLPVDADAKRLVGISSTDEEHETAIAKAREIRKWLIEEQGWSARAFVLADSGNGAHLNIKIDLPNVPENVAIVKDCLEALDFLFSDAAVAIDTTSQNPARIWKLYGTMAKKGDSSPERPHRLSKLLEVPETPETVSREQLEALAAMLSKPEDQPKTSYSGKGFDPVAYCRAHNLPVHHTKNWTDPQGAKCTIVVLDQCVFNPDHHLSAVIIGWVDGKRSYRCRHHSCLNKHWKEAKSIIEPEARSSDHPPEPQIDVEEFTEGGNAHRLERMFGEEMRYCHTIKKWYLWKGGRWMVDTTGEAMRRAEDVVRSLYTVAGQLNADERKSMTKFLKQSDSHAGFSNMLAIARNMATFAVTIDDLDRDPWLLGVGDMTIELKDGLIRESRQEDLITKNAGAEYDPEAQCPQWLKFLDKIFQGDQELMAYIQRAFGYSLTGSMAEQVFFYCYGTGANGKSVFLAILRALLGDYAKQADFSTFLVQRNEKVRNDLAALAGARVVTATEAEEGRRLSMPIIKAWTGGDPVTTRFLFAEFFTYKPVGKLWFAANNKLRITERNIAAWRRPQLIPFNVTIVKEAQDVEIESKLLKELPGILNWALHGLKEYRKLGLMPPKTVVNATEEYRKENDSLELFLSECCDIEKLKVCKNTDLYSTYLNFCSMSGLKPLSQTKFSPELNGRPGVKSTRNTYGVTWLGIELKKDWNPCRVGVGCRVDENPTSIAGDAKDVGSSQDALKSSILPRVCILSASPTYPTSNEAIDIDSTKNSTLHNPTSDEGDEEKEEDEEKEDPSFLRFKEGMRSHVCELCNRRFNTPLGKWYYLGENHYACTTCRMTKTAPTEARPQSKSEELVDEAQSKLEVGT